MSSGGARIWVFALGIGLGGAGQIAVCGTWNDDSSTVRGASEAGAELRNATATVTSVGTDRSQYAIQQPTDDDALKDLKQRLALERAGQDEAVADAVARWPREDQDRAARAWHSWYSVRPVLAHNGYGEWMFDALKVHFSPGKSAELTAFYMRLQTYESMRRLREYPQIHYWAEGGGDEMLPQEWQDLFRGWDAKVKEKNDLLPIAAAGVADIVGAAGLAELLARLTPPFTAETTPDYDEKFRRWFAANNHLNKWRRFLFESKY